LDRSLDIQNLVQRALHSQVRLREFSQPVYIEDAQVIDDIINLTVRTRDGKTDQTLLSIAEFIDALESATQQGATLTQTDPLDFFLLMEATRIRLAYSFDPFFAVSM
jgi:hypothetical protein